MSGKSNTPGSIISLPQGGGALQGIGEKFSPDLQTGTGNFSVPLTLPPGRNGLQPELTLQYSTGQGNGPFGVGWGLSVPGVSRKTTSGIPQYDDSSDIFLISGAEDLVPVTGAPPSATRYRPRTEGLFAHIDHYRDSQNDYWKVSSKDGLVSFYGTPRPANAPSDWQDPATINDPQAPSHIFAWNLTQSLDPFGNSICYTYQRDAVTVEGPHQWDQLYLSQIQYADYGEPPASQFLVGVSFSYEPRPDPYSVYRAGFEIRTVQRCTQIDIITDPGVETPVRTYHLTYLDERGFTADQLPLNGISLLSQIQVEGHDGSTSEWMPPLEFRYSRFEPARRNFIQVTGNNLPPTSLADPSYELADLLGNGLPDIFQMNGSVRYWRNLGGGRFNVPQPMSDAPAGLQLSDPGVQLLDANGDGMVDLLVTRSAISGYFPMGFDGLWDKRSFQRYQYAPSFNLEDTEVRLLDLNGDGVTDALQSGTRFNCFFNDPDTGWGESRRVARQALDVFPNVDFSDPRVKFADLTGDGMQDIIFMHSGSIDYWPNQGWGNWGKRIHMTNSPRLPWGYNPQRILVGDVDGDGRADVVYVEDQRVTVWINQSGNSWSDPIVIDGTPPVTDMDAVRLTDLLGVGTGGVFWSANVTTLPRPRMFFLDFTGGVKPYLLTEMDNHIGSVTRVEYASSTSFYLEDQQQLATQWQTPLPFPVQVVARVEAIDQISGGKLTTEYRYHHGYWDGLEREFRGFGRVDQRDTEVFADYQLNGLHGSQAFSPVPITSFSPPTEARTWFHLGPVGDESSGWYEFDYSSEFWVEDPSVLSRPPSMTAYLDGLPRSVERDAIRAMRGRVLRSEFYGLDGNALQSRPYAVTEHLYGVREESPPGPGEEGALPVFFPFEMAQRTTQWERGSDPMTQFVFFGDYDIYGQLLAQFNAAVPRKRNYAAQAPPGSDPYLATLSETIFAQRDDLQWYCVNRIARSTSYEIVNDGSPTVFELAQDSLGGSAATSVFGQSYTYYDGLAFQGYPLGQLGDFGAVSRTETLVFTKDILDQAYRSGGTLLNPPEEPPYLTTTSPPSWTADYPQEFQTLLPPNAGYVYHAGGGDDVAGFFTTTGRQYDFQQGGGPARGLVMVQRDPLGNDTSIVYDTPYQILPVLVTDPAGLQTQAAYDYRVMKPQQITDPNGNSSSFTFTPLGLLATTWVQGKPGEGDQQSPSIQRQYGFLAFVNQGEPISVTTIRREYHDTQTEVPLPQRDQSIQTVEYSDGFGRLVQTRTQAEAEIFGDPVLGAGVLSPDQTAAASDAIGTPAGTNPWVVVSGWQVYDNKGRVVEKYEPFFDAGWIYSPPTPAKSGQKVTMFYDPRGLVTLSLNPDGSEQIVVYGVPGTILSPVLANPGTFEPTPWETYTYDANDNAGRTDPAGSSSYQNHWNTPSSIIIDALGRTISSTQRNGSDWFVTTSTYDIQGNLLTVTDALQRLAFQHVYDLAKRALRVESIDAGVRRTVLNAAAKPVENRDSKGALRLHSYDIDDRPIRLWGCDGASQALTLRQRLTYGDGADSGLTNLQALALNLLGKPYQQYDEAGLVVLGSYDFKGNVLEKTRQVISDAAILSVFNPPPPNWQVQTYRVDWQPPANLTLDAYGATLLGSAAYASSTAYDALNRIETFVYPQDVTGARKTLTPQYNQAGALQHLELDGVVYVDRIAYNAKGQRSLIAYGNGLMTRYAYDPQTFRLARMCTEPYTTPAALDYHPNGPPFQDFAYGYDLVGNILLSSDRTPGSGIPNTALGTDALDRAFTYDPIYRLLTATGRECDMPPPPPPWNDIPLCTDVTLTRAYNEAYTYDSVGNLLQLGHSTGATRVFALAAGNNHLASVTVGQSDFAYLYDVNGNMVQENSERYFEWDESDRMRAFRTQTGNAEPSLYTHYLYDPGGQRVKKLVRKQGGQVEATVYVDDVFEYQSIVQGGAVSENNTLHVMDYKSRIALVRAGNPFADDATPAVKYQLGDHLGSSNVVVDDTGAFINREEYTPYGETSFGSFARKRYRFTAKERDDESGLCYHGARYYGPWLGRWISCDPKPIVAGTNLYLYVRGRPLSLIDPNGDIDQEGKTILQGLQRLIDEIPQDEFSALSRGEQGNRAHLTLESILHTDVNSIAKTSEGMRLAPEMLVDSTGKIVGFGEPGQFGAAMSGGRTIDVALLKKSVPNLDDLKGQQASEWVEVAMDYKTGQAALRSVGEMQSLVKAPYVRLARMGDVAAVAEAKLATMAAKGTGAMPGSGPPTETPADPLPPSTPEPIARPASPATPLLPAPVRPSALEVFVGKAGSIVGFVGGILSVKKLGEDIQMHIDPSNPALGPVGTRRTDSVGTVWIKIDSRTWVTERTYAGFL